MAVLFVDNLTVVDCSYLHPQWGIEGESWIVDLVLKGALDSQSMVMDFGKVKKGIKAAIDDLADHALLVPTRSNHLTRYDVHSDSVTLTWRDMGQREWHYVCPPSALCPMEVEVIDGESVAALLQQHVAKVVQQNVEQIEIALRPEDINGAYYHYSHGLKKHDGNCQRMAHGHRSRIEIWRNGERSASHEEAWAKKWKHIYLGSQEDVVAQADDRIDFAYEAPQGSFALSVPADSCDMLATDSTVECIADHIAASLKAAEPSASWRVKAYEGVGKGAVAVRD